MIRVGNVLPNNCGRTRPRANEEQSIEDWASERLYEPGGTPSKEGTSVDKKTTHPHTMSSCPECGPTLDDPEANLNRPQRESVVRGPS